MIDFHNHVLPGCDDGAKTEDEALKMLREAEAQGITDVVATVHYQHPKMEGIEWKEDRLREARDRLQLAADQNGIRVRAHLGAEVFFLGNLPEVRNVPFVSFSGVAMLVEFPFQVLPSGWDQVFFRLGLAGVTPILAHPERYLFAQKDFEVIRRIGRAGCLMQIDAGSVLGQFGARAKWTAQLLITEGNCHLLGSDAHNATTRNFCLRPAVDLIRTWVGDEVDEWVTTHPRMVLEGKRIEVEWAEGRGRRSSAWSRLKSKVTSQ